VKLFELHINFDEALGLLFELVSLLECFLQSSKGFT
jgi:hypothetical protein